MKMMVCYNGSDRSKEAVRVAREYAKVFSASLHVATSFPQKIEIGPSDLSERETAQQQLLEIKKTILADGMDCVVALVTDDISDGENLVQYANDQRVDALFIGVRRASKVGKLLFGSTAQHVILGAHCPVISVKLEAAAGG